MDEKDYNAYQERKELEHESLCKRCGACCGLKDNDPCEHLKKDKDNLFLCDIYEDRFGIRRTTKGEEVLCVPIRNILHKTWWGKSECPYANYLNR